MEAFKTAKSGLLTFVNNGITIRQMNQAIMPVGNPATAGLQTVCIHEQIQDASPDNTFAGVHGSTCRA